MGSMGKRNDSPLEDFEQERLANWLDSRGVLWTHPPNGGMRNKVVAAKLKRQGVKAGVPDVLIFTAPPNGPEGCRGVAVELKRAKGGRCTDAQLMWQQMLLAQGWSVAVCHGHQEAIEWLEALGY
jgi:hypothetical protein